MAYDLPNNWTGTQAMFSYANTVTDGWFLTFGMITLAAIIFIGLKVKGYRTSDCFALSFFLSLCLNTLVWAAGLISGNILVLFLLGTIMGSLWSFFDE